MARESGDPVDQLAERLALLQPRLDEVSLRRIQARVHAQLASERSAAPRRRTGWFVLSAAAALLLLWVWPRPPTPVASPGRAPAAVPLRAPIASTPPPQSAPAMVATPAPAPPALLLPYVVAGVDPERANALLGQPLSQLTLQHGERVLLALAQRARISLEGPAQLLVERATDARVELRLIEGVLVGDYDHAQGGELAIHTADASTEIVGTLFSVRAVADHTRVAVAHGSVRVRTGRDTWQRLGARQAMSSEHAALVPTAAEERLAMAQLAHSLLPPAGEVRGTLGVLDRGLRVEVAGRQLGRGPLWALVHAGATRVTLRGDGERRELSSVVRSGERTELVLARTAPTARGASAARPNQPVAAFAPDPSAESEALYRSAEAAMRADQRERATAQLAELVERHPGARSVDLALFDLARLSLQEKHYDAATAWLERLRAHGMRRALEAPAHALRCKVQQTRGTLRPDSSCP